MASPKDVKLYFFPSSFYSSKVLLALYEKDVDFKEHIVNITTGEQNHDWYLRINKNGEVPVLEVDGKYTAESEAIIDLIDQTFTSGTRLVPDVETGYGSEVRDFRKLLHSIPVDVITYGILCNRQLKHEDGVIGVPAVISRKSTDKRMSGEINKLQKKRESSPPELQAAIDKKILKITQFLEKMMDVNKVSQVLEDLEEVFDKIENRLEKSKTENGGTADIWLFGTDFTAADITATILFFRLKFVGLDTRYFSSKIRPIVQEYNIRLMKRPAAIKMKAKFDTTKGIVFRSMLKSFGLTVFKVGVVVGLVGLGYVGLKGFFKDSRTSQKI